jgi:hypothetical protein
MKGEGIVENIVMPTYELDARINVYREKTRPPNSIFVPLGYDVPTTDGKKVLEPKRHYRRYFEDELENNKEIFDRSPFKNFNITRTRKANSGLGSMIKSLFGGGGDNDDLSNVQAVDVGFFKGTVDVFDEEAKTQQDIQALEKFNQIEIILKDAH